MLLYKRLKSGSFQWPRKESEARRLTAQQYRWLMEVIKTLEIIPAQYIVREDVYFTYACKSCGEHADKGCETPIVKAPKEKNIIPGSFATPEAMGCVMSKCFEMLCKWSL